MPQPRSKPLPAFNRHSLSAAAAPACQSLLSPLFRPPLPVFSALLCAWHVLQRQLYKLCQESLKGRVRHARSAHSSRIPRILNRGQQLSLPLTGTRCPRQQQPANHFFRLSSDHLSLFFCPALRMARATKTTLHTSPRITEGSSPACEVGT